jgi:hypothetical protein
MTSKTLEDRIHRIEDRFEIENLMGMYVYLHAAGKHKETVNLFALKTPGVIAELPSWGIFEGPESIERAFNKIHTCIDGDRKGVMRIHALTSPVIEVAGDGKTAKGVWICPGHMTFPVENGKPQANWAWMKYGVDFVKEDGAWKFWHMRIYGMFLCPYDKSWVEAEPPAPAVVPKELLGDRSAKNFWMYAPEAIYPADQPAPPIPYETWDDSMSYVKD